MSALLAGLDLAGQRLRCPLCVIVSALASSLRGIQPRKGPNMTSKLLEVFKGARAYLSDPAKWMKGGYAMGVRDDGTYFKSSTTKWAKAPNYDGPCCLLGAMFHSGLGDLDLPYDHESYVQGLMNPCLPESLRVEVVNQYTYPSIPAFNDNPNTTHADVLRVLDCTIARLEQT